MRVVPIAFWYQSQGKVTEQTEDKSRLYIVKITDDTLNSPVDLGNSAITKTSVKNQQLKLVRKLTRSKLIMINILKNY